MRKAVPVHPCPSPMFAFEVLVLKYSDTHTHTRTYKQANLARLACFFNKASGRNSCPFPWNEEDTAGTQILFSTLGDMFTLEVIKDILWRPAEWKSSLEQLRFMSLPSRPREKTKFFSCEKLFLFTHGLLLCSPSKFSFWSTATHTHTHKDIQTSQPGKTRLFFPTRLQAETLAHFPEMKKTLLAHRYCSVLLGTCSPLRW